MPIKIKTDLKKMKNYTSEVRQNFKNELTYGSIGYELVRTVQDVIRKGISPVDGEGRFEKYSQSYRDAIKKKQYGNKKVSPVNMSLTGEMMGSLRVIEYKNGALIEFTDKKAGYHQNGEGNLPVRKLLPVKKRDTFNKRITDLLVKALKAALKK